eukprot:3180185-Amphidinium_carterae.1
MDLDAFYHINEWACRKLAYEVERIAQSTGGTAMIVPLKDRARARAKVPSMRTQIIATKSHQKS